MEMKLVELLVKMPEVDLVGEFVVGVVMVIKSAEKLFVKRRRKNSCITNHLSTEEINGYS